MRLDQLQIGTHYAWDPNARLRGARGYSVARVKLLAIEKIDEPIRSYSRFTHKVRRAKVKVVKPGRVNWGKKRGDEFHAQAVHLVQTWKQHEDDVRAEEEAEQWRVQEDARERLVEARVRARLATLGLRPGRSWWDESGAFEVEDGRFRLSSEQMHNLLNRADIGRGTKYTLRRGKDEYGRLGYVVYHNGVPITDPLNYEDARAVYDALNADPREAAA